MYFFHSLFHSILCEGV